MSFLKVTDDIELHPPDVKYASIVFALVETYIRRWEGQQLEADTVKWRMQ